jgi:hypothetical protein
MWNQYSYLLDRDGTVRFGPADLPAGGITCTGAPLLAGDTFAVTYYTPDRPCYEWGHTLVVDVASHAQRELHKTIASAFVGISPDGKTIYESQSVADPPVLTAFSAATGEAQWTAPGALAGTTPDGSLLLLRGNAGVAAQLTVRDRDAHGRGYTMAAEPGVGLGDVNGDPFDMAITPAGAVITLSGSGDPDMCTNIGLRVYTKDAGQRDVTAAACSFDRVRYPRVTEDGSWLVYLDDAGGQLDVVALDLVTGEARRLTSSPEPERGFVLRTSDRLGAISD